MVDHILKAFFSLKLLLKKIELSAFRICFQISQTYFIFVYKTNWVLLGNKNGLRNLKTDSKS
jgi:hypothetical protein